MAEWRPVVGYEQFYEVSDLAEIRSLPRRVGARGGKTRVRKPRLLRPIVWGEEYWRVVLTDADGNKAQKRLHHLVAAAFLGPRPPGMLVLHKDDNKTRNCPENLYYGTSAQNARDRSANGNWKPVISRGEKHGGSKLRERDIPVILSMRAGGATFRSIADSFGVADMTIQDVVKGRRWGWLTGIGGNP